MTFDVSALRRAEFPWAERGDSIYLNNASTGPLPERARRAADEYNQKRAEPHRLTDDLQFGTLARARELVARLIGAKATEIGLTTNTSFGINIAAAGLPLGPGDVVLTPDLEFPANVYPWMHFAAKRGFEYRRVPCRDGVLDEEALVAALDDPRVKLLSVSWVGFATGYAVDLGRLGRLCAERDVFFVVDAIQGLGALPVDVHACHVDVFACGAQKWLLGPWGSGFVYVAPDLIPALDPGFVSWMSVRGSDDFTRLLDYDFTWRPDARRFEFVTLPYQDFAGMVASLELFHEIGPRVVTERVASLSARLVQGAEAAGIPLVTPRDPARRGGIVSVRPAAAAEASARLKKAGVVHSLREGMIRLSPHFYNTESEIDAALAALLSS